MKYQTPKDIMFEFFTQRQELYKNRKEYMMKKIKRDYEMLSNKVRFILGVIEEEIKVGRVKRKDIMKRLVELKFNTMTELNDILMKVGKTAKTKTKS
jgi:DNA topoisomerase-2